MIDEYRWAEPLDPEETKDYELDWSSVLEPISDTISSSSWTLEAKAATDGLSSVQETNTSDTTVIWLTGGEVENLYRLTNEITTAGGRTLHRTILLEVDNR